MKHTSTILKGSLILTGAGIISRIIGFFYRIFLSNTIGSEGLGLYQMVFPVAGLCLSICSMGISTSVSRFTASKPKQVSLSIIRDSGILLSLLLSILFTFLVYQFAEPISIYILSDERCIPLLQILALSIPFSALHGVINGSFYGQKKTIIPAVSQLIEQFLRVGIVVFFWYYRKSYQQALTASDVMTGLFISELGAVLFLLLALQFHKNSSKDKKILSQLLSGVLLILPMAIPLSATHFFLDLIHSAESILIPNQLRLSGLNATQALSLFGVFSGMAMPFIQFPSTITNSLAVMLLPTVSKYDSSNASAHLIRTCNQSIGLTMLLGILCTGFFVTYGRNLGLFFFSNETAGIYIQILAWLCPFLYLITTLGSILNGLGETMALFFHNLISSLLRLGIIIFLVPRVGILGYLWGLLLSYILCVLMHYIHIARIIKLPLQLTDWVAKPFLAIIFARIVCWAFQTIYSYMNYSSPFIFLLLGGLLMTGTYCIFLNIFGIFPKQLD